MKLKLMAVALSVMMLFCGCGEKYAEKNDNPSDNKVAENVANETETRTYADEEQTVKDKEIISAMLDCYKNLEYEDALDYIREADRQLFDFSNATQNTLYDNILSQIEYTFGEDYFANGRHYVEVNISAPDMLDIYGKINLQYIDAMLNGEISSEEESREFNNAALKNIIAEGDFNMKETTSKIELQQENGEEKVVFTAELMNAMLGDIQNAQQQVSQAIEEGMAEYNSAKESGALD